MQGPNVKRLIIMKMFIDAIPEGGDVRDGVRFLTDMERIRRVTRTATDWVEEAVRLVKCAPNNPFGDDDEAIAGEIIRQIEERKARTSRRSK